MRRRLRGLTLKHLSQSGTFPSGNPRLYFRPKGRKGTALPDLPEDHPGFLAAYVKAAEAHGLTGLKPRAPIVSGSLAAEIELYKRSDAFALLAPSTRAVRRRTLDAIATTYGHGRIRDFAARHVEKDLDKLSGHARNNRLKVWRGFGIWLKDAKRVTADPTLGAAKAKVAKSDGHEPWSADELTKFRERWPLDTVERLAFELIFWTGARVSDAVRLGAGHVDREGWLAFRQQKTGGQVWVPYARELPEFAEALASDLDLLKAAIAARPDPQFTFLHTAKGSARSPKAVSQWFAKKARAAGLTARTAHGLRKSRTIALVEAQATTHQVGAWTGHESLKEIEGYARKFSRRQALTRTKQGPEVPTPATEFQETARKDGTSDV